MGVILSKSFWNGSYEQKSGFRILSAQRSYCKMSGDHNKVAIPLWCSVQVFLMPSMWKDFTQWRLLCLFLFGRKTFMEATHKII